MANTFELISAYTASTSVSSISFTSIPSTYTDLVLKLSARQSTAAIANDVTVQFNATASGNSNRYIYGDSASAGSGNAGYTPSLNYISIGVGNNATANTFGNVEVYLPNYASSNYKSFSADSVGESNGTSSVFQLMVAGLWSSTSAINQITITAASSANFLQYSTAYLYGVKNA